MTMITLTLAPAELAQVRTGDLVTAIDGRPVSFKVTGRYGPVNGGPPGIPLRRTDNGIRLHLYPDTHVERTITVERPVRTATRTVDGVRFTRDGDQWSAAAGRYVVSYEEAGVTTCEQPHPVREARGRGYLCQGAERHFYKSWMAIDTHDHSADPAYCESFKQAAQEVASWMRPSPTCGATPPICTPSPSGRTAKTSTPSPESEQRA